MEIFKKVRNTRWIVPLIEDNRFDRKLDPPRDYEENSDWLRITDIEEFKRIWDSFNHSIKHRLDEFACYVHKTDPSFNEERFVEYKQDLINKIGEDKVIKKLYSLDIRMEGLTYYELEALLAKHMDLDIELDDDKGTFKITEAGRSNRGTDWDKYTVPELKEILASKDLAVGGKKVHLIKRLEQNADLFKDYSEDQNHVNLKYGYDWHRYNTKELKTLLESKGLSTEGDQTTLITRLVNNKGLF